MTDSSVVVSEQDCHHGRQIHPIDIPSFNECGAKVVLNPVDEMDDASVKYDLPERRGRDV